MSKATRIPVGLAALALAIVTFAAMPATADRPSPRMGDRVLGQDQEVLAATGDRAVILSRRIDAQVAQGNLKLAATQVEELGGFVHERFDVYHQGLKVWGAQVIRHSRSGQVYLVNGEFHDAIAIDVAPAMTADEASARVRTDLDDPEYKLDGAPEIVIFPGADAYHLAYMVTYKKGFESRIVSFVDAKTGIVVFQFDDVMKGQAAIGVGIGTFGDTKKMSTDSEGGTYRAIDLMRPAKITTGDLRNGTSSIWYVTDDDNNWTSDPTVVDAHTYMGFIYDYYYLVHNRRGMFNNNGDLLIAVHYGNKYENAFYDPGTKYMIFGDGNPSANYPYAAALDIVAHEFTHGVTDATSDLVYAYESGALNEAFSDIMGVSCEFFHQPQGTGYLYADWWEGEDIEKSFKAGRSLSNPASVRIWEGYNYFYPDHYSKRFVTTSDYGGVHLNCTIGSHWYYLLANGGTNRTSGQSVTGIGLSKAEKIAYAAWTQYFTPTTNFHAARNYTYQAAVALYGSGSAEAQTVLAAWTAVGVN